MKNTWIFLIFLFLAFLPVWGSPIVIQYGINALILATLAQSWNIIGGYTGYSSFGNSVFYGVGGYSVATAMLRYQFSFGAGLILAACMAVIIAILIGIPVLRLRGHYFAITTLALTLSSYALITNIDYLGGNIGLVLPIGPSDSLFFELSLGLLVLTTAVVLWISNSRFGLGLLAIRENELAASQIGVNTTLYKILAFSLSALFTSLAGGIHAYWITFIDPESAFDLTLNVKMIIMTLFGGTGTVLGPIIGAFSLSLISDLLSIEITNLAGLFFGIIIVLAILFMPHGVIDLARHFKELGMKYFLESIKKTKI